MSLLAAAIGIGSSLIGSSSAKKAAASQEAAANRQIDLQEDIYDQQVDRFQPYVDSGLNAQATMNYLNGIGPAPTFGGTAPTIETVNIAGPTARPTPGAGTQGGVMGGQLNGLIGGQFEGNEAALSHLQRANPSFYGTPGGTQAPAGGAQQFKVNGQTFNTYEDALAYANANKTGGEQYAGFEGSPGFQYQLEQGLGAVEGSAAARGNLFSGSTLTALQDRGTNLAQQDYANYYNRLAGTSQTGQSSVAGQAAAGQNYGTGVSNALDSIGNAQAAGAIGVSNAVQSGINTGLGIWQYQNSLA